MKNLENYGFSLLRSCQLDEIDATLHEMEHIKTGAKLVYIERNEENKTFCIGFPTPPCDDTGVFHIIEHSVLCGSEKFPLRDPFAEFLKGSLNTFLNAMTYEDRTIYPVASRCEKDFLNLTDLYLDAVFAPNLLRNPAIFMQEGWHYEYDSESNNLSINGVVYNEMKGAYSSPDELSAMALNKAIFGNEIYRYDSGGNPDFIPELSYEQFKATYEKYYHPSSAHIVLDGQMDLSKILPLIDSHLSKFDKKEPTVLPKSCTAAISPDTTISYEISENESVEGKTRVTYGFIYDDKDNKESHLCAGILADILCGSNASPLKKALLDRGLCKDAVIYSHKTSSLMVVMEIRDTDPEKIPLIDETIREVVSDLVTKGIDKNRLTSTLNSMEFRLREQDFGTLPSGIAYTTTVYSSWIYGDAPESGLIINPKLKYIREMIETDYFEQSLKKIFLECDHRARVIMLPDKDLGRKNSEKEEARLKGILESLSQEQLEEIINADQQLKEWQQTEESDEAMASIPSLTLDDIPKKASRPEYTIEEKNGVKIVKCSTKTNGIVYVSMHFDASDLAAEELIQLSLLCSVLLNSPTKNQDALSLQNDIKSNLGSFYSSFAIGCKDGKTTPYFKLFASSLSSKTDDLLRITKEVLTSAIVDSESEITNIIMQIKSQIEDAMIAAGDSFALSRVEAGLTEIGAITEYLSGYEAYKILCRLAENKDEIKSLTKKLPDLLHHLVDRQRLILSVTGDAPELSEKLIAIIPDSGMPVESKKTPICADNSEFIMIPSKVAYAAMGSTNPKVSENLGILRVARSILSYEYLWNTVRVKNGAYGAGFVVRRDGGMEFYSYRDPSPENSIGYYKESSNYLRSLVNEGCDITKFVIGAIGEYDIIISPKVAAALVMRDYLNGYSADEDILLRKSMINVKAEDLLTVADIIDEVLTSANTVIVGGAEHLKSLGFTPKTIIKI